MRSVVAMLDIHYVRENFDLVVDRLRTRNFDVELLSRFRNLDMERRLRVQQRDELNARSNQLSRDVGNLMREGRKHDAESLKAESRSVAEDARALDAQVESLDKELQEMLAQVPNLPHESVPVGQDETSNVEVRRWGTPRDFEREGFAPKDHVDLGAALGILDQERAVKLSGARFAVLNGIGATLERALINFMLELHTREHGYQEMQPPFLVNGDTLFGTGQLPKFEADLFKLTDDRGLYLIPTAEVPLTGLHGDEILDEAELPISYTSYTPCFRSEAGSYGRDTRGLIRQHQFDKVELVKLTRPEDSYQALEDLTRHACTVLERLGLPYRVVTLSTGDTGFAAAKTYDLEVWLPSQGTYREISSCSNCEGFQARRAGIRFRRAGRSKSEFVHTLNGSGLAVGRTWLALLENFQQADGSVIVPEALAPYLGVSVIKPPAREKK